MGDQARHWRGQLRDYTAAMLGGLAEGIKSEMSAPRKTSVPGTVHLKRDLLLSLAVTLVVGIPLYVWETKYMGWTGIDWQLAYYPAGKLLLRGHNPYDIPNFHNPIWALIPLLPLVLSGERVGAIAVFFINLFSFAFIALRLGAKVPAALMLVLSPLMLYALYFDNIDWLVLWGFILPPPIGLFFVVLKPQVGIAVAIYWAYRAWQKGRWRTVVTTFAPLGVALATNWLAFGLLTRQSSDHLMTNPWNMSGFPWSIPIGLLILFLGLRYKRMKLSISASPFLSPYLNMGSWTMVLVGIVDNTWLTAILFVIGWLLFGTKAVILLR